MTYYEEAMEMKDEMIRQRRDFHAHPETAWTEFRTTSLIAEELQKLGYEVLMGSDILDEGARMMVPDEKTLKQCAQRAIKEGANPVLVDRMKGGMTGCVGIMHFAKPGKTVALRFDIDSLFVAEDPAPSHRPSALGFQSKHPGLMHACGHDGHATIGLGVAKVLMSIKDSLHGTMKLIFQPAEEGVRGAKSIVENGHLDGVDYLIGSHVSDKADDDPAVVIPGSHGSLATTKYDVFFHGVSAHAGGSPEKGKNVMPAVATAILNLYGIPRNSAGMSRINVGTVVAGSGRNVIADVAKMEIEVRGETTEINQYMEEYAKNIIEGAAKMHGCTSEMKVMGSAYSLTSDQALMDRVRRVCEEKLHLPVSETTSSRNGGSEDVSYMMRRVQEQGGQATFMRILTKESAPGHNRRFDFDEQALPNAVKVFCGTVYDILG